MNKRAILLFSSPDRPGLVHAITGHILEKGGNIVELEQFVEKSHGHFFMRIVWEIKDQNACALDLDKQLEPLSSKLQGTFKTYCSDERDRLALFCSDTLHCLGEILLQHSEGLLPVDIPLIISNSERGRALAEKFQIPFKMISTTDDVKTYEEEQLKILQENRIDFIGLARYMKILSTNFVEKYQGRIINIHHSFLPSFIGRKPYHEAYERGVKIIGATSHFVIPELDLGPIIEQDVLRISHAFDVDDLIAAGREVEKKVFLFALKKYVERKLMIHQGRVIVFQ